MGNNLRKIYANRFFFCPKSNLLGNGIEPEHLNDYKIGRVMDKLYQYGLSELFVLIALSAAKKYNVNLDFSHLDSSSFSVHGQYNQIRASELEFPGQESELEPIPTLLINRRDNTRFKPRNPISKT